MLTPVNTVRKSFKRPNLGEGCGSGTSAPDSSVLQERDLCFVTARLMAGDGGGADVVAAVALAAGDGDKSSLVPTFWSWKHLDPMIDLPLCKKAGLKLDQNNSEMRQAESNPACVALARQRDNVSSGGLVILPFRPCGCEGRTKRMRGRDSPLDAGALVGGSACSLLCSPRVPHCPAPE